MRVLLVLGMIAGTAAAVAGVGRTLHTLMTAPSVTLSPPAPGQLADLEITVVPARQAYTPAQPVRLVAPEATLTATAQSVSPAFPIVTAHRSRRTATPQPMDDSMSPERKDLFEEALATLNRQFDMKTPPNSRDILEIQSALEHRFVSTGRMSQQQFDDFLMNARVVLNRNPARFIHLFRNVRYHDAQGVTVLMRRVTAAATDALAIPANADDPRLQGEMRRDAARDRIRESLRSSLKIEPRTELSVTRALVSQHGFTAEQIHKGMQLAERSPEKFSAFLDSIPASQDLDPAHQIRAYAKQVQEFVTQAEIDHE